MFQTKLGKSQNKSVKHGHLKIQKKKKKKKMSNSEFCLSD